MRTWQLFAIAVAVWGTTWHAIVYQLQHAPPELGVALRFGLAGLLVLGFAALRGERLRLAPRAHARLALQGVFMYSLSYLCVYHAERHVPSGLVAIGYSAAPLLSGLGAWLLWRTPVTRRFVAGGLLGVAGVALIFEPEFAKLGRGAALGAAFTVGAVLLSSVGSLTAQHNREAGVPLWPALGYGMVWGAALSAAVALASGQRMAFIPAWSWWLSLAYLSIAGSVVAFACFLTLQQRVGIARASTLGVMTPVLALAVSTAFEGYRPGWPTALGTALALLGNWLMLHGPAAGGADAAPKIAPSPPRSSPISPKASP